MVKANFLSVIDDEAVGGSSSCDDGTVLVLKEDTNADL
jgi:hypothetical protein